jgi:hypothetical protein
MIRQIEMIFILRWAVVDLFHAMEMKFLLVIALEIFKNLNVIIKMMLMYHVLSIDILEKINSLNLYLTLKIES